MVLFRQCNVRLSFLAIGSVLLGIIVAGCGGGGGGGSTTVGSLTMGPCLVTTASGQINYTTIWGTAPTNASQVLQVIDVDGFVVRSDSISNRNGSTNSTLNLTNIVAGTYELRATIYNSPNAAGGIHKELRTIVDLCSGGPGGTNLNVQTSNALAPTSLRIAPASLNLVSQQTIPVFATAMNGSIPVFSPLGSISYGVTGGVGTLTGGIFTATTAGTGTITSALAGTSLTGSVPVTVTSQVITQGKWTVLVYLNAANDLFSFSDGDVNEMEQVAGNPDVRFVLQWKQSKSVFPSSSFDGVRRYLVKPDSNPNLVGSQIIQSNLKQTNGDPLDMGDPQTLRDFVAWGKANYPADRYVLILWNHGNGWKRSPGDSLTRGFSYDDESGNSINTWEIGQALQGQTFDILSWDSSLMQMMEVAYEARTHASYIVGSEESPPGEGLPYHLVFDGFRDNPNGTTAALTNEFVTGMLGYAPYNSRKITQSVIDSSKLVALRTSIDNLATLMIANAGSLTTAIPAARNNSKAYSDTSTRKYRDLVDVCLKLEADVSVPTVVKTACADVRAKVTAAVIHEGNNANSEPSYGISIDFSPSGLFTTYALDYAQMKFAQDSSWNEFLSQAP